MATTGVGDVQA